MTSTHAAAILQPVIDAYVIAQQQPQTHKHQQQRKQATWQLRLGDWVRQMQHQLAVPLHAKQKGRPPPRIRQLRPDMALALLLAYERNKGPASFWHVYIAALPATPSTGWLLHSDGQALQPLLGQYRTELTTGWLHEVAVARNVTLAAVARAADAYGPALGISQAQLVWALDQVQSRGFGNNPMALLPFIDMMNHKKGADAPDGYSPMHDVAQSDDDYASDCAATQVTSRQSCASHGADQSNGHEAHGQPDDTSSGQAAGVMVAVTSRCPLQAGQELCISYAPNGWATMKSASAQELAHGSALLAFLNFGWVPPELQQLAADNNAAA
eukprot:jgi/Chrzof1/3502/Cz12g27230.t1